MPAKLNYYYRVNKSATCKHKTDSLDKNYQYLFGRIILGKQYILLLNMLSG